MYGLAFVLVYGFKMVVSVIKFTWVKRRKKKKETMLRRQQRENKLEKLKRKQRKKRKKIYIKLSRERGGEKVKKRKYTLMTLGKKSDLFKFLRFLLIILTRIVCYWLRIRRLHGWYIVTLHYIYIYIYIYIMQCDYIYTYIYKSRFV